MATSYQITIRNETEDNPHILVFDPNADPNALDPSSVWQSFDPPSGPGVPFTFTTDYGVIRLAGVAGGSNGDRRARIRSDADLSTIDLAGIQSADLVVRGSESEGYSFSLENVRRD